MIAVVQRVSRASVTVESPKHHAEIGPGLCVLLCAVQGDTEAEADWMAGKLARLRIFRDEQDKMNRSVQDIKGEALVISQFTLAGETSNGNRPSFIGAAAPELGGAPKVYYWLYVPFMVKFDSYALHLSIGAEASRSPTKNSRTPLGHR